MAESQSGSSATLDDIARRWKSVELGNRFIAENEQGNAVAVLSYLNDQGDFHYVIKGGISGIISGVQFVDAIKEVEAEMRSAGYEFKEI